MTQNKQETFNKEKRHIYEMQIQLLSQHFQGFLTRRKI